MEFPESVVQIFEDSEPLVLEASEMEFPLWYFSSTLPQTYDPTDMDRYSRQLEAHNTAKLRAIAQARKWTIDSGTIALTPSSPVCIRCDLGHLFYLEEARLLRTTPHMVCPGCAEDRRRDEIEITYMKCTAQIEEVGTVVTSLAEFIKDSSYITVETTRGGCTSVPTYSVGSYVVAEKKRISKKAAKKAEGPRRPVTKQDIEREVRRAQKKAAKDAHERRVAEHLARNARQQAYTDMIAKKTAAEEQQKVQVVADTPVVQEWWGFTATFAVGTPMTREVTAHIPSIQRKPAPEAIIPESTYAEHIRGVLISRGFTPIDLVDSPAGLCLFECAHGHVQALQAARIEGVLNCTACNPLPKKRTEESYTFLAIKCLEAGGRLETSLYMYLRGALKSRLSFQCNQGHSWNNTEQSVLDGVWCPQCYTTHRFG